MQNFLPYSDINMAFYVIFAIKVKLIYSGMAILNRIKEGQRANGQHKVAM